MAFDLSYNRERIDGFIDRLVTPIADAIKCAADKHAETQINVAKIRVGQYDREIDMYKDPS